MKFTSFRISLAKDISPQTVVPRELELNGRITKRSNGQIWRYSDPVGNHPLMTELLLKRAGDVAPDAALAETSLLIVAHGTDLNENSAVAAKREAEKIRALGKYAAVLNVYMEEPPLVSEWRKLTKTPNVVVVPFFISDGLHSYEDIPRLLGMVVARVVHATSRGPRPGYSAWQNLSTESLRHLMVVSYSTLHPSGLIPVLPTSSSTQAAPAKS